MNYLYNLLVVDDEEIAVRGIVKGIDWSDVPINEIIVAYDVEEAKQKFSEYKIHVLLSDIDMPDNNGIELLRWVREFSSDTETIFLTGHADFSYAQQAVHLDSFDYLLKPVDHTHLKSTLINAIDKVKKTEQMQQFQITYEHFYQQWYKQLPILSERFWQDVINLRIPMSVEHLEKAYSLYEIPLTAKDTVQVVLISVEQWSETLNARDEEIMTYAVKNATEEIILVDRRGQVIQDISGIIYAIVYPSNDDNNNDTEKELEDNCKRFIEKCKLYLHCTITCYIGEPISVPELNIHTQGLLNMERNHLCSGGSVVLQRSYKKEVAIVNYQPNFTDWAVLLEMGKRNELILRIEDSFDHMQGHVD
ncbi:MAG: response regulator, partial [Bacilli bacterium]